jgi:hypothetical protein
MTDAVRRSGADTTEHGAAIDMDPEEGGGDEDEYDDSDIPAPYTRKDVRMLRDYPTDEPSPDRSVSDNDGSENNGGVIPSTHPSESTVPEETLMSSAANVDADGLVSMTNTESDTFASNMVVAGEASDSIPELAVRMRLRPHIEPTPSEIESETQEGVPVTPTDRGRVLSPILQSTESPDAPAFQVVFAPVMSFRDGFYYNVDGIKYVRHGEPGNYTYEESASISLQDTRDRPVSPTAVDAMVNKAYEGSTGRTMEENE